MSRYVWRGRCLTPCPWPRLWHVPELGWLLLFEGSVYGLHRKRGKCARL